MTISFLVGLGLKQVDVRWVRGKLYVVTGKAPQYDMVFGAKYIVIPIVFLY